MHRWPRQPSTCQTNYHLAPPFPDSAQIAPNDSSFGMWTAVLASDASKGGQTLEIKVVQTWETPVMSLDEPIEVILRSPENKDVILPTIVTGPGVGLCDRSEEHRSEL